MNFRSSPPAAGRLGNRFFYASWRLCKKCLHALSCIITQKFYNPAMHAMHACMAPPCEPAAGWGHAIACIGLPFMQRAYESTKYCMHKAFFMHASYARRIGRKRPFLGSKSDHFLEVFSTNRFVRKVSDVGSPRKVTLNFLQMPLKHFCNFKLNKCHFFQNIFLGLGLGVLENFGFWRVFGQPVQGF